jgi:hypothetical protein
MYPNLDMQLRIVTSTACRASCDTKRRWLHNYRRSFQHATFDFVDLTQINWRAVFFCPNAADHLTADGICIGHKLAQSFIVRPWEAASDAPLTPGTVLHSGLMVPEPRSRKGLLQFTSASAGGLSADDLQQLVTRLPAEGDREATIAPFLAESVAGADGKLLAAPQCRPLLRSLGTTAPAIQLMPCALWQVDLELKNSKRLSFQAEASLWRYSPLLHGFLQPHLNSAFMPANIINFVDMLRQVGCDSLS